MKQIPPMPENFMASMTFILVTVPTEDGQKISLASSLRLDGDIHEQVRNLQGAVWRAMHDPAFATEIGACA